MRINVEKILLMLFKIILDGIFQNLVNAKCEREMNGILVQRRKMEWIQRTAYVSVIHNLEKKKLSSEILLCSFFSED